LKKIDAFLEKKRILEIERDFNDKIEKKVGVLSKEYEKKLKSLIEEKEANLLHKNTKENGVFLKKNRVSEVFNDKKGIFQINFIVFLFDFSLKKNR